MFLNDQSADLSAKRKEDLPVNGKERFIYAAYLSPQCTEQELAPFTSIGRHRLLRLLWAFPSVFLDKVNKERFADTNIKSGFTLSNKIHRNSSDLEIYDFGIINGEKL